MSAHTPGPWRVEGTTVYALHGNPPRNRFSALVQAGRRDDASEEELIANANLMSAAPKLLALLDRYVALDVASDKANGVNFLQDSGLYRESAELLAKLGAAA